MHEKVPFPDLGINYDSRYPASRKFYPFVNELTLDNGAQLVAVSGLHFNGDTMDPGRPSENWQFSLYSALLHHIGTLACDDIPTVAYNEGGLRDVDLDGPVEVALLNDGDPGMFTWIMQKNDIKVKSWDLTIREEVSALIAMYDSDDSPAADVLRSTWPSDDRDRFKEYVRYFEEAKFTAQYLRLVEEESRNNINVALGGLKAYVQDRFVKRHLIELFDQLGINSSGTSLHKIHDEVCEAAGLDLPLDPSFAPLGTYRSGDYSELLFPPTNASDENHFMEYAPVQRIGGMTGRKLRNEKLADVLAAELFPVGSSVPPLIIVSAGGRHVPEALRIMHERSEEGLPLHKMQSFIGEHNSRMFIELGAGKSRIF
jgi:hypothetical protein